MSREYTAAGIRDRLGITQRTLTEWCLDGLPHWRHKGERRFDASAVAEWCIKTGKARRDEPEVTEPAAVVLRNRKDVAAFFGVNTRTIAAWLEDPTFPGKPGPMGKHDAGFFPVKEIAEWLVVKNKKVEIPPGLIGGAVGAPAVAKEPTERDRLTSIRAERAQFELKKLQGQLIDAEEAAKFFRRTNEYARTVLCGLPARLVSALPASVDDPAKKVIRTLAERIVDETCIMIAELIEGDQDEHQTLAERTRVVE